MDQGDEVKIKDLSESPHVDLDLLDDEDRVYVLWSPLGGEVILEFGGYRASFGLFNSPFKIRRARRRAEKHLSRLRFLREKVDGTGRIHSPSSD